MKAQPAKYLHLGQQLGWSFVSFTLVAALPGGQRPRVRFYRRFRNPLHKHKDEQDDTDREPPRKLLLRSCLTNASSANQTPAGVNLRLMSVTTNDKCLANPRAH